MCVFVCDTIYIYIYIYTFFLNQNPSKCPIMLQLINILLKKEKNKEVLRLKKIMAG